MARARNVKPGLFKNELLGVADPLYTLLFEGLWLLADREGRLEDRPVRIKGELFPYRDGVDVAAMLLWLEENGFIRRYEVDGQALIQIAAFGKHQAPHGTEKDSDLPDENGLFTVHVRGKNGYATGEFSLVKRCVTVKEPCNNSLTPDSLIPDSLIPEREGGQAARSVRTPKRKPTEPSCPGDVDAQVWADWLELRRKKSAPVTSTVIKGARSEAEKAGISLTRFLSVWCVRGTQGLQAEWLKPHERGGAVSVGNKCPPWCKTAGFDSVWEAENAGCREHNAGQFRDGKRTEAA
jgi:hypothetical protein